MTQLVSHIPLGNIQQLADVLDEALELLKRPGSRSELAIDEAISPSLFEQCIELCRQGGQELEPIRTIHHLSCTGGTLIAKCFASMPNVMVLNEIDPLSTQKFNPDKPDFTPTDFLALVRQGNQHVSEELLVRLFTQNLELLRNELASTGKRLLLRDHSHSHFMPYSEMRQRPSVLSMVKARFPVRSLVTVRNPLDSFISLDKGRLSGWKVFRPFTIDEYCKRYLLFLDAHVGLPIFKYETFVNSPAETMQEMCAVMQLRYSSHFTETFDIFRFSGDSGRAGMTIEPRPRQTHNEKILSDARASDSFRILIERLDYEGGCS